jgi:hypothetical protein
MNRVDILSKINDPKELEKLYQGNKMAFKKEFNLLYPELMDNRLADYWNERLNYESFEVSWGSKNELIFVIIASLVAGIIAKLPALLNANPELFYQRNAGLIIFPALTAYFIWKKGLSTNKIVFAGVAFLIAAIFINLLPADNKSDTLILSCIHLPIFLWAVLGFSYVGDNIKSYHNRIDFLRYNGDLIIMTGLLAIAAGILTAITIGLFELIGFNIKDFYFDNIVVFALPAIPILATYITQTNPQLVNRVSPVIAKIFSPLVLITLFVYLIAIFVSGKNPYNDREFLMVFNCLLIGVMAIILFSVAEIFKKNENRTGSFILFALSIVTVIVNGIALSAILFRISEWGITPNRLAVLGANILMLTNLLIITFKLFKNISKKTDISEVEDSIAMFLPIYILWVMIVTFIFPLIFHFK